MKKSPFFLAVVAMVLLAGCSQLQSKLPNDQNPSRNVDQNVQQNSNDNTSNPSADNGIHSDELTAKMNVYVECLNQQSKPIADARGLYLKFVDPEKGPTGKEPALTIPYYGKAADCVQNINKVQEANPRLADLEKAGAAYAASLQKIDPLLVKAHDYYNQKDYKDDNLATGKEMHPVLMQAWDEFEKADTGLRIQVDKINSEKELKELADIEKSDGRKIPFLVRYVLHSAELVAGLTETGDLESINLENLKKAIDDLEKASTELNDYIAAHPEDENVSRSSLFVTQMKGFLGASKDLMRRIRDKQPYSESDQMLLGGATGWMVEGSPEKVIREYNTLVQYFNNLINFLN